MPTWASIQVTMRAPVMHHRGHKRRAGHSPCLPQTWRPHRLTHLKLSESDTRGNAEIKDQNIKSCALSDQGERVTPELLEA